MTRGSNINSRGLTSGGRGVNVGSVSTLATPIKNEKDRIQNDGGTLETGIASDLMDPIYDTLDANGEWSNVVYLGAAGARKTDGSGNITVMYDWSTQERDATDKDGKPPEATSSEFNNKTVASPTGSENLGLPSAVATDLEPLNYTCLIAVRFKDGFSRIAFGVGGNGTVLERKRSDELRHRADGSSNSIVAGVSESFPSTLIYGGTMNQSEGKLFENGIKTGSDTGTLSSVGLSDPRILSGDGGADNMYGELAGVLVLQNDVSESLVRTLSNDFNSYYQIYTASATISNVDEGANNDRVKFDLDSFTGTNSVYGVCRNEDKTNCAAEDTYSSTGSKSDTVPCSIADKNTHVSVTIYESSAKTNQLAYGEDNVSAPFSKDITIDSTKVDADLTDFPVLIYLNSDSDLSTYAQSSGDDIKFENSSGTQLSHEIESYDSGSGTLWAHVKVGSLSSSSDTTITMKYGDSGAANQESVTDVWTNDYVGVWHLDEEASGTGTTDVYKDSTSNNYHGTDQVGSTGQTGQISDGQAFDGTSSEKITIPHDLNSEFSGNATVSGWVKRNTDTPTNDTITGLWRFANAGANQDRTHYPYTDGNLYIATFNDGRLIKGVSDSFDKTQWHMITVTNNSTDWIFYRNGNSEYTRSGLSSIDLASDARIGESDSGNDYYFDGNMDEIRLSKTDRSSGWIATQYNNQNDPSAFYSVGSQQSSSY